MALGGKSVHFRDSNFQGAGLNLEQQMGFKLPSYNKIFFTEISYLSLLLIFLPNNKFNTRLIIQSLLVLALII